MKDPGCPKSTIQLNLTAADAQYLSEALKEELRQEMLKIKQERAAAADEPDDDGGDGDDASSHSSDSRRPSCYRHRGVVPDCNASS